MPTKQRSSLFASTRRPTLRFGAALVVLFVEYLVPAVFYDGGELAGLGGDLAQFGNATVLVAIGSAVLTAGLLAKGRDLLHTLREASTSAGPLKLRALLAHAVLFAAFLGLTHAVFAGDVLRSRFPAAWLAAWFVAGAASVASLFWLAAGDAWSVLARALWPVLASGLVTGTLAWYLAWLLRPLWPWMVSVTLPLAARLLQATSDAESVHVSGSLLSFRGFRVDVAPECSGVEGIFVVSVLVVGYWVASRKRVRFPNALLLWPIAVFVVFWLNVGRIAALMWIGASVSPAVALGGFHSRAGWLSVCAVVLATVWVTEQMPFFARRDLGPARERNPALPYCMPLFVSTGLSMLTGLVAGSGLDWFYFVHIVGAALAVAWYRPDLGDVRAAFSLWPLLAGVITFGLWLVLTERGPPADTGRMLSDLVRAPEACRVGWLTLRVVGSVFVVPISEELAFRGFLQRRLIAAEFTTVSLQRFSWLSLLGSSIAFGAVHSSFASAAVSGVAFSLACYRRGNLADAIVAHATANALIAVAVLGFGQWWLW